MSFVALDGPGLWMPTWTGYMIAAPLNTIQDTPLLDADEEEAQIIGTVMIDGGGTKTFGTSSKIGWHVGAATITFALNATLRVGVKQASKVETTAGPPARATIGAAAFDVWDDLVGGTDTLTAATWREETMTAGTPFTVTHGDLLAVCLHLNITSGTHAIKMRNATSTSGTGAVGSTVITLVTSGPTYGANAFYPNIILIFNDGTLGWFEQAKIFTTVETTSPTIGQNNSIANIVQVPFPCQIDALGAYLATGAGTGDCALEVLDTPLGTPTLLDTVAIDANMITGTTARSLIKRLPAPRTLTANTPYAISLKQTTAQAVTGLYFEAPAAAYLKAMGANCYGATSTAGATFVAQTSGRRRYHIWMRISAVDDGAGGAALLTAPPPRTRAWRQWRRARVG